MTHKENITLTIVDVGVRVPVISKCEVRFGVGARPYPHPDVIQQSSRKPGAFGHIDRTNGRWTEYLADIRKRVDSQIGNNRLVVLPEFAGSPELERHVRNTLRQAKTNCCVVAGSYYTTKDGITTAAASIILHDGRVFRQRKFEPSDEEEKSGAGCKAQPNAPLYVFQNTGFGDFAVLICSDATGERVRKYRDALGGLVDILVVVARNKSRRLTSSLTESSANERWAVVYCNGLRNDSDVLLPLRLPGRRNPASVPSSEITTRKSSHGVDIYGLHHMMAQERDWRASEPTRITTELRVTERSGFRPQSRHWPSSMRRGGLDFRRFAKVLAIGSHFDDIWLGCAATLMVLEESYGAEVVCETLCDHYDKPYFGRFDLKDRGGALEGINRDLCHQLNFRYHKQHRKPEGHELSDRSFVEKQGELRARIQGLWETFRDADLVFVPRRDDAHDDHVLTARTVLAQFKQATVLEYEVKEFRRIPFQPSLVVDVGGTSRRPLALGGTNVTASPRNTFAWKKALILRHSFEKLLGGPPPGNFGYSHTFGRLSVRAAESSGDVRYAEAFSTEVLVS